MPSRLFTLALGLSALVLLSPVRLGEWSLTDGSLRPIEELEAGTPVALTAAADLDRDGTTEQVELAAGRVQIRAGGQEKYASPAGWQVLEARLADLNRDGRTEMALLVWREFADWPIDRFIPFGGRIRGFHDGAGRSCHLILIGWKQGAFRELWAGSALAEPLVAFEAADLDGDGAQELVALEGAYAARGSAPAQALAVWKWNGFGFSLTGRMHGSFGDLIVLETASGRQLIMAESNGR